MRTFKDLNADIAASIPSINSKRTLLDLVLSTTRATAMEDMAELLDTLKAQEEYGVFYIFDEHNEMYREPPGGGQSPLQKFPIFLGRFTRWTGPTGGASIFIWSN